MPTNVVEGSHTHLESMRKELADLLKANNALRDRIIALETAVREEQEAKYRAYVRIADLTKLTNQV
jgi:hypothetical protein